MKKSISILLIIILAATLSTACASANYNDSAWGGRTAMSAPMAPQSTPMPMPAPVAESALYALSSDAMEYESGGWDDMDYISHTPGGSGDVSLTPVSSQTTQSMAEKIIYSVYAEIETRNFDETIENVQHLLTVYGAFIEFSNVSGVNYASRHFGWNEHRNANFTLRVPVENLDAMEGSLKTLGNVTNHNRRADNITSQFIDTQSRVNSLRIQEERLLDMLRRAEDIPDLIAIESQLSHVRYQIESFQTTLNHWQSQVDYSDVTLYIREVEIYTDRPELHRTYWQQIGDGFMATVRGVGSFFMDLFKWIIIAAPVLVILAVIGVGVFILVRIKLRKIKEKKKDAPPYTPPVYPQYQAPPQTLNQNQQQENDE